MSGRGTSIGSGNFRDSITKTAPPLDVAADESTARIRGCQFHVAGVSIDICGTWLGSASVVTKRIAIPPADRSTRRPPDDSR